MLHRSHLALLAVVGLAGLDACASDATTFLPRVWSATHTVVVVLTGESGAPLPGSVVVLAPGERLRFDVELRERVRVHVHTWAPDAPGLGGRSILECGAVLDGAGPPLPEASSRWVSPLAALRDSPELALVEEDAPPSYQLRFERCLDPDPCAGYLARRIDGVTGLVSRSVVAIDDERAFFGVRDGTGRDVLLAVTGHTGSIVPDAAWVTRSLRDLALDADGSVWALLEGGSLARFEPSGRLLDAPASLGLRLEALSFGRDGTKLALDKEKRPWELTTSSTVAQLRDDFPDDTRELAAVRRDRVFMRDSISIWSFDGVRWAKEQETPLVENVSALGGDEDVMVVVGELEVIRVRDEVRHTFDLFSHPFDLGVRLRAVVGLGGGRFLVGGERGALAAWTGERWCPLDTLADTALSRISVSPSKRTAFVAGDDDRDSSARPAIIRVDVPPP